jgi:hypothetical protein
VTYARDAILFLLGVVIILKQAGIGFTPPSGGPSLELLSLGILLCNGPLFLQYVSVWRATPGSSVSPASPAPSAPSSSTSSEDD